MTGSRKEQLVDLILKKLENEEENLKNQFRKRPLPVLTRSFVLDDLLPLDIANEIYEAFPKSKVKWRELKSLRENKFTAKNLDKFPQILEDMTFAIQDRRVVKKIEEITGIKNQLPDPSLYAGGLSMMGPNHFLNPHLDNSHDGERKLYRRVNLLYYISPDWKEENGGNLELWDPLVKNKKTIISKFNRLAVMETNDKSWHGVSKVQVDSFRCCVSNYYFSVESPKKEEYFHITEFSSRPEEKVKGPILKADNWLRTQVRKTFKLGLGKQDLYSKKEKTD